MDSEYTMLQIRIKKEDLKRFKGYALFHGHTMTDIIYNYIKSLINDKKA